MRTAAETPIFQRLRQRDLERRREGWSAGGQGKRGGARVVCFNVSSATIWQLIVCKKAKFDSLRTWFLAEPKQGVEYAF